MCIPKYNSLNTYIVTCIYVFRTDHLALTFVLFPGKDQLSCSQHSSVACSPLLRLETSLGLPCPSCPAHRYHHCPAHIWEVSLGRLYEMQLGDTISKQTPSLCGFCNLPTSSFSTFPKSTVQEYFVFLK